MQFPWKFSSLFPPANSLKTAPNSSLKLSSAEKWHAFNNSIALQMVPQGMNLAAIYTINENGELGKRVEKLTCLEIEDAIKMPSVSLFR